MFPVFAVTQYFLPPIRTGHILDWRNFPGDKLEDEIDPVDPGEVHFKTGITKEGIEWKKKK